MAIEAFLVLCEDRYETVHGDGYYAYYAGTFATRAEAEAFIATTNPPQMVAYHVRAGTLTREGDGWTMTAALEPGERIDTNGDGVATDWAAVARSLGAL